MTQPPSPQSHRSAGIKTLQNEFFDVIIIGGGITGAGIALDASLRGLKVALIEKRDFASGTSSKSTKLIHGGLRYLKQYEFSLVREVGKERAIVHKLAPHLVRPEKMLLPLIKDGNYGKIITSVGLMVYDVLAKVEGDDQRKMLTQEETLSIEPLLDPQITEGGGLYSEYQTDDFRLVIEAIKTAVANGTTAMNYLECTSFLEKGGKVCGVKVQDQESRDEFQIYGDYVINAGGPWVDRIRSRQETISGKKLHLTKGVHLVVPHHKLPVNQSVYFDVADGRMIFAIPKKDITYIGTTDTEYTNDLNQVTVSRKDAEYLISAVNKSFPSVDLTLSDIVSSWAGIRPLIEEEGKSASEISRKDEIFVSEKGLISMAGGKLTGYRKMAKRAVDQLLKIRSEYNSDFRDRPSRTKKTSLIGGGFKNSKAVKKYKKFISHEFPAFSKSQISYLVDLYGDQTAQILANAKEHTDSAILKSEVLFCLQNEFVRHLTDFFIHRTGRLFFDIQSVKDTMQQVADIMQAELDWSEQQKSTDISTMESAVFQATNFE